MTRTMFIRALFGVGAGSLVLTIVPLADDRSRTVIATALPALGVAVGVVALTARLRRQPPSWLGGVLVAGSAWLLSQSRAGAIEWVLAAGLGLGVALGQPVGTGPLRRLWTDRVTIPAAVGAAIVLGALAFVADAHTARLWGTLTGVALATSAVLDRSADGGQRRSSRLLPVTAVVALVLVGAWVGANSSKVSWFGPTMSHGPRNGSAVAISFDDGPNATTTLALSKLLLEHNDRATFFTVGKAVAKRPDITRTLIADGQLIGNHSYLHDQVRWLDPRYPELMRAEHAIHADAGVCPALFRPPHGQHTPFMTWELHRHGMHMVTWDVSTNDWSTRDPQQVAAAILAKVRPGSIIDLHDGLDGDVTTDRSVLVGALPLILDGLHARGLHSVTLDTLLGVAGYLTRC